MDWQELVDGWQEFKRTEYPKHRSYLEEIAHHGVTKPLAVVSCVDARVNLAFVTGQRPGTIAQHQTIGNVIPPYGMHSLAQEAFLEYVIRSFHSEDLAIVGHTDCKMITGLLGTRDVLAGMGTVTAWAYLAKDTRSAVLRKFHHLSGDALITAAAQVHVLLQVQHLMTYPIVHDAVLDGHLKVHPMLYDMARADLLEFSDASGKFELLGTNTAAQAPHKCHSGCLHIL